MKCNSIYSCKVMAVVAIITFAMASCSGGSDDPEPTVTRTLTVSSQSIAEGSVVKSTVTSLVIGYSAAISLNTANAITINGTAVSASVQNTALTIPLNISDGNNYTLVIPANAVHRADDSSVYGPAVTLHFSSPAKFAIASALVNVNATTQAKNVYEFLVSQFGKKTLSGAMANVANNNYMSDWIYAVTGKHPALTCYDFIHIPYSPANWIDYNDITPAKTQWQNNGLVAYMWHWCVPNYEGAPADSCHFYCSETNFDIREALKSGTWQNKLILSDIKKVAGYLQILQDNNIAVIWRPLHEAAGNYGTNIWFWWGRYGTDYTKQLWKLMYDQLVNVYHLNNLIWVWTAQIADGHDDEMVAAYPGNDYVDIVGADLYVDNTGSQIEAFNKIKQMTGGKKLVTLAECGLLLDPDKCFTAGDTWSWFMEWYTYKIASTATIDGFGNTTAHWKEIMTNSHIINREDMPLTLK